MFVGYGRQRGWERDVSGNELSGNEDGFVELSEEECCQLEPVSYTHLDVYKRQNLYWVLPDADFRRICGFAALPRPRNIFAGRRKIV